MSLNDKRLQEARDFLRILHQTFEMEWRELFPLASSHENWFFRMAAIHPKHYQDYIQITGENCPIRGQRRMTVDGGVIGEGCRCDVLWGYCCDFGRSALHADHLFPYSFGGPSNGQNKVFLCEFHNRAKGSDIHLFPWENGEPGWLLPLLKRIDSNLRGRVI
jgi:hypothetical protein